MSGIPGPRLVWGRAWLYKSTTQHRNVPCLGRRSRGPLIEIEQPAEPRMASDATPHLDHWQARNQAIAESLVIPFAVVMLDECRHGSPEMPLADRNQPIEAFFFDRSYESSSGGESHPSALTEPDVRLSPHPAPTIQPPA